MEVNEEITSTLEVVPHTDLHITLETLFPKSSLSTRQAVQRLAETAGGDPSVEVDQVRWQDLPKERLAGVLVLLHIDKDDRIMVTLTTRSKKLRTSPGETAFPGGRYESHDADIRATALREANEEIGLPLDCPLIHLTDLHVFLSATLLFVVPVVYLLATNPEEVLPKLRPSPAEVTHIFHRPLLDFLMLRQGVKLRRSHEDVPWINGCHYRLHHFSDVDMPSPTTGLTADMLIHAALIASGSREASFVLKASDQMTWSDLVRSTIVGRAGGSKDKRSIIRAQKDVKPS